MKIKSSAGCTGGRGKNGMMELKISQMDSHGVQNRKSRVLPRTWSTSGRGTRAPEGRGLSSKRRRNWKEEDEHVSRQDCGMGGERQCVPARRRLFHSLRLKQGRQLTGREAGRARVPRACRRHERVFVQSRRTSLIVAGQCLGSFLR